VSPSITYLKLTLQPEGQRSRVSMRHRERDETDSSNLVRAVQVIHSKGNLQDHFMILRSS